MSADEATVVQTLPLALDRLGSVVMSVRRQVTDFLAGSETIFLQTGGSLETLRTQAVSLVATSAAVVETTGAGDDDAVARLSRGCVQIEEHLAVSRRALDGQAQRLRGILTAIERLNGFRHLFRRAASALRMLGMSTSIENARAGMESTGFATVAADVRRLGGLVETRFEGVLDESLTMKRTAEDALARVTDLTGRQSQRASSMLADAHAGLEALRGLAGAASSVGVKTSQASKRVVESVTSVVVSLQVHDIVRQMMEHALHGLQEIEADIASASSAAVAGSAAADTSVQPGEIVSFCRLQASQLRQARSRLEGALRSIPTSLRAMSAAARELADETCRLGDRSEGGSLLDGVERGVAHAMATLREQLRHETEIEQTMDRVMVTIGEMLKRLRDVERIGRDLKIIGLNAGIEAAKTTQGGRVLSVLARSIQELSTDVGDQTSAFASVVHRIAADASSATTATEEKGGIADGALIAAELEGLLVNLRSYNSSLLDSVEVLASVGGSLGRGVDEISERIQSQARAVAVVVGAEGELLASSDAVHRHLGRDAGAGRFQRLQAASARYTTEAERDLHRAIVTAPGTTPATKAPAAAPAQGQAPRQHQEDLGDNVELF